MLPRTSASYKSPEYMIQYDTLLAQNLVQGSAVVFDIGTWIEDNQGKSTNRAALTCIDHVDTSSQIRHHVKFDSARTLPLQSKATSTDITFPSPSLAILATSWAPLSVLLLQGTVHALPSVVKYTNSANFCNGSERVNKTLSLHSIKFTSTHW